MLKRLIPCAALLAALAVAVPAGADALADSTQPILAGPWSPNQEGYGQVEPSTVSNGGDPTGIVQHIHWHSWGGTRAEGTGIGWYVGPRQITADGKRETAHIVVFQLGYCHGRRAYEAIEWYFPRHGGHFRPNQYIKACMAGYHS
jgi:hypothetical protein